MVNGTPILSSDAELAELSGLVPRVAGEAPEAYRRTVVEALIALELRWQDLEAGAISSRTTVDLDAAWEATVRRAGGQEMLHDKLATAGLTEIPLRGLVKRAAVVEAYVAIRFAPFARPTGREVEQLWQEEAAKARASGKPVPPLEEVRSRVEDVVRERKLTGEVERWTQELARRAEVVRYLR